MISTWTIFRCVYNKADNRVSMVSGKNKESVNMYDGILDTLSDGGQRLEHVEAEDTYLHTFPTQICDETLLLAASTAR